MAQGGGGMQQFSRRTLIKGLTAWAALVPTSGISQPARGRIDLSVTLSRMIEGSYRFVPVSLDRRLRVHDHIAFAQWQLRNRVYVESYIRRNRRDTIVTKIESDGRFQANNENGILTGRFESDGSANFEGTWAGRHWVGRIELFEGRQRTTSLRDGRQIVVDLEPVPQEEALRIAARLYPAEYGQSPGREPRSNPTPTSAGMARRRALVVGTGNYSSLPDLPNPPNDARVVAQTLTSLGYHVDLILDAGRDAMVNALARFRAERSDAARSAEIFYYAGHAVEIRGRNYLLATDMPIQPVNFESQAVSVDLVLDHLSSGRRSTRVLILDACRNGPSRWPGMGQGLAQLSAPQGTYVAYSTAPGMVATDGSGRNSPFTLALVNELARSRQPIEAVFRDVRRAVVNSTGGQQIPWDSSSLVEPFYFADR